MKFCKVADIADWQDQEFRSISTLLGLDGFKNRKVWEHIQVYKGLKHLGLLQENARALGLGSGRECLIYAFANVCGEVIATDLYNTSGWSTASLSPDQVYEQNSFPYRRDRLTVRHMDMTRIEYPEASFDFVWSCCAIEHVDRFSDLHQVYREIHRVLKPGGIAALTTEYNLTDRHSYEPNMLFTDRLWVEKWLTGKDPLVQGFELLDTPQLTLTADSGNTPQPRRQQLKTSVAVYSRDIVLNSVAFFLRKTGEFSRSYEEDWLPQPWRIYLLACDQLKQQNGQAAEDLLTQLLKDEQIEPRVKVAALHRLVVLLRSQNRTQAAMNYCKTMMPFCDAAEDTDHLLPLAHHCKKMGLWKEAKYLYEKIEHLPGSRDAQVVRSLIGQAEYFAHQNQFQTALKLAEKAQQNLPLYRSTEETATVYYHQGFYHEQLGQWRSAITAYQCVLDASQPGSKMHQKSTLRLQHCLQRLEQPSVESRWTSRLRQFLKSITTERRA